MPKPIHIALTRAVIKARLALWDAEAELEQALGRDLDGDDDAEIASTCVDVGVISGLTDADAVKLYNALTSRN